VITITHYTHTYTHCTHTPHKHTSCLPMW